MTSYYNLITAPYTGLTITLPDANQTIYNNFTVGNSIAASNGITQLTTSATPRTVEVKQLLTILQYGTLRYMNVAVQNVVADTNIFIATGGSLLVNNAGTTLLTHALTTYGTITNNGILDLDPNYPTNDNYRCSLTFAGLNRYVPHQYPRHRHVTNLYGVTVNKGSSMDVVANVNVDPTNFRFGGGGLTLQNGTFRLTTSTSIALATGSITIPSTACLSANGGSFYIDTAVAGDVNLIGRLEILTGAVQIGHSLGVTSTNANNIVYPAAITPEIIISSGSLSVYSQIRRGTSNNAGSLHYKQYGGTVSIGGFSQGTTTRAALEVLNTGSDFEMTGGTLIIARHISNSSPYDLYLDSDLENVTSGGTIQFGLYNVTTSGTVFTFLSSGTMGNLTLDAQSNACAIQEVYQATLTGSLTIGGPTSYYSTNGLDITIAGNFTNNNTTNTTGLSVGGFQSVNATQTTGFNGTSDQTITGTGSNITNFADMEIAVTSGHTVSLASGAAKIQVNGDLTLTSGTFNDNANTITVLNNVDNNAVHTSPNATTGGIVFGGSSTRGFLEAAPVCLGISKLIMAPVMASI